MPNPASASSTENKLAGSTTPAGLSSVVAEFAQPGVAFRGKPFWSWNGVLEKDELVRQLSIFKEMGMGGAFMHSRTGLKTEYLGKEWFELINACADECEQLGLEAWLYDEDRWPSGTAGGMATEDPAYRMKALQLTLVEPAQFVWPEAQKVAGAFLADINELHLKCYWMLEYGAAISAGQAGMVLLFTVENTIEHSFYNGATYLDTLNRKATEHFLESTHEKYRERCGERLGKSIKGIFTDEPHHGLVFCHTDECRTAGWNPDWSVPYTAALFERFEQLWGYDLRPRLPELFLKPIGKTVSQVKWHYMELLQRLFLENWAQPCQEWCHKNHMILTGHVLHEDSLVAQAVPCGSLMRYYEYLDYPGVDLLCNNNRSYWVAKQLQSAARQLGKKWLLSELYGCTGWQFDFASHKETGFWQALFGINLRCHHLSWVTMAGEAKRDYPASISFQSGWYPEYKTVEDYFSRLHVVLQQGEPVCDVLIVNPVESVWAQIYPGWAQWLGAKDPGLRALEQKYEDVFHWLAGAQVDFDYGDEDHIRRLGAVETVAGEPVLRLGQCRYRVVVVGAMATMRSSTLALLEEFQEAGGKVIFIGEAPAHVDALPSDKPTALAAKAVQVAHSSPAVIAAVKGASRTPVAIACETSSIFCQVRRDGEHLYIVAINTSREEGCKGVRFSARTAGSVQEWDCDGGARFAQPASVEDGALVWEVDFPPLGTRVFVVSPESSQGLAPRPSFTPAASITLEGPFDYTLNEPNLCVLDCASYRIGAGQWQPAKEILQVDTAVREALRFPNRSGMMVQPWAAEKLGLLKQFATSPLALRFQFGVDAMPQGSVELVMEMPEKFSVRVNGTAVAVPANPPWMIDPCMKRIPLSAALLKNGLNEVELTTDFAPDIDLEAIYLAGSFGVSLQGTHPVLGALPAQLQPGDVAAQGLPFYSGTVAYRIPLPAAAQSGGMLRLETGAFGGALAKVRVEENAEASVIAWPPYHADIVCPAGATALVCEVLLTRINTFGPLHITPKEQNGIGPFSFRTEGGNFSKDYQLWPAGLLTAPVLVLGK